MQTYRVFIKYCVISKILKYIPDSVLSRFPLGASVCVHNGGSNTSAAAELAEFRKVTTFKGKTQYLMSTLYLTTFINHLKIKKYFLMIAFMLALSLYPSCKGYNDRVIESSRRLLQ